MKKAIVLIFLLIHGFGFKPVQAQTIEKTLDYYRNFHRQQMEIANTFSVLISTVLEGGNSRNMQNMQKELLKMSDQARSKFLAAEPFFGQEHLKQANIRFAESAFPLFEKDQIFQPIAWEQEPTDTIIARREMLLKTLVQYGDFFEKLEKDQMQFQMLNRVPEGRKIKGVSNSIQGFIRKTERAMTVSNLVLTIKKAERGFLQEMATDSMPDFQSRKNQMVALCDSFSLKIKKMIHLPHDARLKESALSSLRLYRQEANQDWPRLQQCVEKDRQFFLLNQQMKKNLQPSEAEKNQFREAVRQYNLNLKSANEIIRNLEAKRNAHEKSFDEAFAGFLKDSQLQLKRK